MLFLVEGRSRGPLFILAVHLDHSSSGPHGQPTLRVNPILFLDNETDIFSLRE
jgi:hypothetical protein